MPTGPGPRQRRATKIANRSHVTPFDRLAQWNAQIMNLGAQGSIPSIVGNTLKFVKLNASSIPGIMDNPATEDLDMNSFGIIRANRLEVDSNPAGTPYVSIIGGQSATLFVKSTNTALIEMEGPVSTVLRGKSKLKIETDNNANSNNIDISPYGTLALQSKGVGGAGSGTIVIGDSSLALLDLNGTQISLDAGNNGLQLSSNTTLTIDAASNIEIETFTNIKMLSGGGNIEIDAIGRLDLSGSQIFIDSDGVGVNISAANVITMDAATVDIEANTKLDLSGNNITINSTNNNIEVKAGATLDLSSDNSKLNGTTTVDITGARINIGTSSSIVDISGQITLNKVANLTATNINATDITASNQLQGAFITTGASTGNTITTFGEVTAGSFTDGTATMSSGTISDLVEVKTATATLDPSASYVANKVSSNTGQTANPPYAWGEPFLEQVNTNSPFLLGTYKQTRTAFFKWVGDIQIDFALPNNSKVGPPSTFKLEPPCAGNGTLLPIGTPLVWDLPSNNFDATYHTFTIPEIAFRTLMTIEIHVDLSGVNTSSTTPRESYVWFFLGKNLGPATGNPLAGGTNPPKGEGTGPMAYFLASPFLIGPTSGGTNVPFTYTQSASITLLGGTEPTNGATYPTLPGNDREGRVTKNADFGLGNLGSGDTFYFTAYQGSTIPPMRLTGFRIKITWEAVN